MAPKRSNMSKAAINWLVAKSVADALAESELKKLETELWNLVVKGTDIESYTQRFQKIILLCSRMVLDESDKVEKLLGFMSALRHLFKKQDAKPRLIRWILFLQEFDIEIKDRKDTENIAADHLSRIKNEETSDDSKVDDNFPREILMEINTEDDPWFADFANYLASDIIPKGMTYQQNNFFSQTSNTTSGRNPTSSKYVLTV
ncbi:hypothetical protein Tco_0919057 [Tanacetum coccineum]